MSLLNFPPPSVQECAYSLQEYNGQIIAGTRKQFDTLQHSKFLTDYPRLERTSLSKLQHSLSKDDVKGAFIFRRSAANVLREIEGKNDILTGDNDENAGGGGWSKTVLRVRNGLGGILSKMASTDAQTLLADSLDRYATTRGWSEAWLRCVAVDGEGGRVAVCQSTDYIRIYGIGSDALQPPLTLHHAQMKNVAAMQFDPHDARLLAVAAGANVLVWRLSARMIATKPTGQCIRIVETGVSPLSSLVWDSAWGNSVMVASCNTNKIILTDLSTGTHSSVGAWFGGGVTGLYPSKDGTRLAVTYTSNILRIYDRSSWTDEKWGGLAGRATGVVWSPTGESLLFSTEEADTLFAISFSKNVRTGEDGVKLITWSSGTRAVPVFDLSPIQFDPLREAMEDMLDCSTVRAMVQIGGPVRSMTCSADGERLALTFTNKECCGFIATFIVDWASLPVKLYPTGFVEAAFSGTPSCVFFLPQYSAGSMLAISWSTGSVQYVPLIYGKSPAAAALSVHPLVESTGVHTILEESLGWAGGDSLASVELSSRLIDREDRGDSPLCFTEMLKEKSMVGQEI